MNNSPKKSGRGFRPESLCCMPETLFQLYRGTSLVRFKAHRLVYRSTLGWRVTKNKHKEAPCTRSTCAQGLPFRVHLHTHPHFQINAHAETAGIIAAWWRGGASRPPKSCAMCPDQLPQLLPAYSSRYLAPPRPDRHQKAVPCALTSCQNYRQLTVQGKGVPRS